MKDLSMMKILVVDDIEDNIDVLLGIVGDDFDISVAMDGEGALEIAEEDHPDLILLDIMMPGMDGYEVCRRLKENKDTSDIPVIFLTAKSEVHDETRGFEIGAVDYITKPISPPIVIARVKTQLEIKKNRDEIKKAYKIIEAQKERMMQELNAGRNIQMSMIPRVFPERDEFSISARLRPAREVGGDFYDFFFIDENHLLVCVGDVSGKGVPASLYMAVTLTLIRTIAKNHRSTATIVTRMNDELTGQNNEAMFVTMFVGILDLDQGNFTYTNAGHNPSYSVKNEETPKPLKDIHGIPLGIFTGKEYEQSTIHFDPGDFIFMYTDGVTDSQNKKKEMYGDHRLFEEISSNKMKPVETIVETIFESVQLFGDGSDQYDDTTVMVLKYKGG